MADALSEVLKSPGAFALRSLKAFRANQGLLLAGAVAYYALLSIVPLLILVVIALSHWLDRALLLETLQRYLRRLVPRHGAAGGAGPAPLHRAPPGAGLGARRP